MKGKKKEFVHVRKPSIKTSTFKWRMILQRGFRHIRRTSCSSMRQRASFFERDVHKGKPQPLGHGEYRARHVDRSLTKSVLFFVLPIVVGIAYLFILWSILDPSTFRNIAAVMAAEFFPPSSIEFAVPLGYFLGLNPYVIIGIMVFQNVLSAVFIIWNYHLLFHIPKAGKYVLKFRDKCHGIIEKKKFGKHTSILALFLFFLAPFKGTGSVSMAFIGKMIGIENKYIILISVIGTIIISAVILVSLIGIEALIHYF